ncbi:MAG: hypothetical protein NXH82_11715 [Rhodobacteraceae bacterium]|nr:hypothetical protein [Paracoccaceae bacterium]
MPVISRFALLCALTLPLVACTQFPALDEAVAADTARADYPELMPTETLRAMSRPDPDAGTDEAEQLRARRQALLARAARMAGPVVNDDDRARLNRGVPVAD